MKPLELNADSKQQINKRLSCVLDIHDHDVRRKTISEIGKDIFLKLTPKAMKRKSEVSASTSNLLANKINYASISNSKKLPINPGQVKKLRSNKIASKLKEKKNRIIQYFQKKKLIKKFKSQEKPVTKTIP